MNLDFFIARLLKDGLSIQMRDQAGLTSNVILLFLRFFLERVAGIEPASLAWKAFPPRFFTSLARRRESQKVYMLQCYI